LVGVSVGAIVSIVRLQPPAIDPTSLEMVSSTNSCQVPFGSVPLKTLSMLPNGGGGAGAGNVGDKRPGSLIVGLNVPETSRLGTVLAAASSKVNVTAD
jgi:hypothetical protein